MSDFRRVFLIVLDACGIGELPDAADYGDAGSNTIGNTAWAVGGLSCPQLEQMGLGKLTPVLGMSADGPTRGAYGKMAERSAGKDSTSGHWELAGLVTAHAFPTYSKGFPPELLAAFTRKSGYEVLGNKPASGTEIIEELGQEHLKTGRLIVYTSADSVFQIAAHFDKVPLDKLYHICRIAREILIGEHGVARVIARPFIGRPGRFTRTTDRRDFSLAPTGKTILDNLHAAGIPTIGVGKIDDLFAGVGLAEKIHTRSNTEGMEITRDLARSVKHGFIFVNLVEFDMLWGHRNDPRNFAAALEAFDRQLGEFIPILNADDLLLISADHGCDPTTPSTDHSREYVPILSYSPSLPGDIALGVRSSFADAAATVAEVFAVPGTGVGTSFLPLLRAKA
jgi:phosphopentomutase